MAHPKYLIDYNPVWFQILEEVDRTGRSLIIEFPTKGKALSEMFRWCAFLRLIKKEEDHVLKRAALRVRASNKDIKFILAVVSHPDKTIYSQAVLNLQELPSRTV